MQERQEPYRRPAGHVHRRSVARPVGAAMGRLRLADHLDHQGDPPVRRATAQLGSRPRRTSPRDGTCQPRHHSAPCGEYPGWRHGRRLDRDVPCRVVSGVRLSECHPHSSESVAPPWSSAGSVASSCSQSVSVPWRAGSPLPAGYFWWPRWSPLSWRLSAAYWLSRFCVGWRHGASGSVRSSRRLGPDHDRSVA